MDFLGGSVVKNPPANAGAGSVPGLGRFPREENGNPLYYYCLGNPMDKKSLACNSPQGLKRVRHDLETKQHYIVFSLM